MMPVGKANEHSSFPGTLTLESETVQRLWTEIAESIHRVGIRKLVLFNSHGGNRRIMEVVARDIRVRLDMLAVVAGPNFPEDLFSEDEMRYGIHGGSVETSLMLHWQPELVGDERVVDSPEALAAQDQNAYQRRAEAPHPDVVPRVRQNPAIEIGVWGDPSKASREIGKQTCDEAVGALVELIRAVEGAG